VRNALAVHDRPQRQPVGMGGLDRKRGGDGQEGEDGRWPHRRLPVRALDNGADKRCAGKASPPDGYSC
jgi:hypothetical protein